MSRSRLVLLGIGIGFAIVALALGYLVTFVANGIGCVTTARESGSALDRYCEAETAQWLLVFAPAAVVIVGGALSVWTVRSGLLVGAVAVAFICLTLTAAVPGSLSSESPDGARSEPGSHLPAVTTTEAEPVQPQNRATAEQLVDRRTTTVVRGVSDEVARCLRGPARPERCAAPSVWSDVAADVEIRVEVLSRTRYTVTGRSPLYATVPHVLRAEVYREQGRTVYACTPPGAFRDCGPDGYGEVIIDPPPP